MFLLLHSAAVSEPLHHGIKVMVLSPNSEASIDIIHDKWSVITHLALLEDCECCGPGLYIQSTIHNYSDPEPAMMSLISQAQIIFNCFSLSSIPLLLNIFKHSVLLHSISLKVFSNIFFSSITLIYYLFLQFFIYLYYDFFFESCYWLTALFDQESANYSAPSNTSWCWLLHH